jgi:hypothetical protein
VSSRSTASLTPSLPPLGVTKGILRREWGAAIWQGQVRGLITSCKFAVPGWKGAEGRQASSHPGLLLLLQGQANQRGAVAGQRVAWSLRRLPRRAPSRLPPRRLSRGADGGTLPPQPQHELGLRARGPSGMEVGGGGFFSEAMPMTPPCCIVSSFRGLLRLWWWLGRASASLSDPGMLG